MIFNNKLKLNNKTRGFSLVEILIGSSIICLSLILIVNLETSISEIGLNSNSRVQATMLAEEGVIAIKNIRNTSWQKISSLSNDTLYRLYWDQTLGEWQATTSVVLIDGKFDRSITFSAVNRDIATSNVVLNGGVIDPGTKKFVVNVSWQEKSGTSTRSLTSYIHNTFNK